MRLILTALLIPFWAGCGGNPSASPLAENAEEPRQVRLMAAAAVRVPRTVSATGTLAAEDQVVLGTKVPGRVSEIGVDLGSRVRQGEVIARIDPTDYRLRVEQAQAAWQQARARLGLSAEDGGSDHVDPEKTALVRQAAALLKSAQLTHDRMEQLWNSQLISRAEMDLAVSQLGVAQGRYQDALEEIRTRQAVLAQRRSELEIARQQLTDTVIMAPLEGAVRERQATVGQYLAAGAPLVTLVRTDPLRLRLAVPEREASGLRIGQAVRLSVEGDPTTHSGRVARLSPAISEDSRTLLLEAEVPDPHHLLRPGSFAKAEIVVTTQQEIIVVPLRSVVTFAGIEKVLMRSSDKAVERRVKTGRRLEDQVEILEGIAAGDEIIADPGNLVGGQLIQVVE